MMAIQTAGMVAVGYAKWSQDGSALKTERVLGLMTQESRISVGMARFKSSTVNYATTATKQMVMDAARTVR